MQRVAIARALVNDPEILLADEPTGALDSNTSVQVMDLLREVAKDRLVVMVTHNPELAELYATRIVNLRDGKIRSDTNPYQVDEAALSPPEHKNMGKSSMSFLTALALSFNNLKDQKGQNPSDFLCRIDRYHRYRADPGTVKWCQCLYPVGGRRNVIGISTGDPEYWV